MDISDILYDYLANINFMEPDILTSEISDVCQFRFFDIALVLCCDRILKLDIKKRKEKKYSCLILFVLLFAC